MSALVREWMTADIISVQPSTSLDQADAILSERDIRRLLVIDDDVLVGLVSLGDIRAAKASASADTSEFSNSPSIADIMSPDPITIPQTASLGLAAQTMLQLRVSGLPVVDENGKLCGLLSESDLFRYIVDHAE